MRPGATTDARPLRPALSPWCRLIRDGDRYLVEEGGTLVTFEGRAVDALLPRLLPLLDGTRTTDELAATLGPAVAPAIEQALSLLDAHRLLVERMPDSEAEEDLITAARFAAAVTRRTNEADAARRISNAHVAVVGSGAAAADVDAQLRRLGCRRVETLSFDADVPTDGLVVAAPAADEIQQLESLNHQALALESAWLQLLPFDGRFLVVGPLFLSGHSACRSCYVLRRGACSGYEDDFAVVESVPPRAGEPAFLASFGAALAASIVLRWIATADPTLPGRLYALECGSVVCLTHERVLRVPRCAACGTPDRAVPSPWFDEQR